MIVKYKLLNPKINPSFPYDRVYKIHGITGVYTDFKNEKWVVMSGKYKHCFSKKNIILISIEREENDV